MNANGRTDTGSHRDEVLTSVDVTDKLQLANQLIASKDIQIRLLADEIASTQLTYLIIGLVCGLILGWLIC